MKEEFNGNAAPKDSSEFPRYQTSSALAANEDNNVYFKYDFKQFGLDPNLSQ